MISKDQWLTDRETFRGLPVTADHITRAETMIPALPEAVEGTLDPRPATQASGTGWNSPKTSFQVGLLNDGMGLGADRPCFMQGNSTGPVGEWAGLHPACFLHSTKPGHLVEAKFN